MKDLLHTRAWEVQESPIDLGYKVVPEWGKLPEGCLRIVSIFSIAVATRHPLYASTPMGYCCPLMKSYLLADPIWSYAMLMITSGSPMTDRI